MHIHNGFLLAALGLGISTCTIESHAQDPVRLVAVEAQPGDNNALAAQGDAKPEASPFEIRYIISYVLMLLFIGGSTVLIIRPSGRAIQGDSGAAKAKGKK